jgi:hypothetical protein
MTKITKTLKLVIIGLIFLLGLHFTANFTHKDFVETFINEKKNCYDLLVKKGNHVFLYNSSLSYVPGVNPVQFNNLEEYTEYVQWERANGINCPVLFLQHEYDAQNNSNYKLRPSLENQQGGLNATSCNSHENKEELNKKVTAFNDVLAHIELDDDNIKKTANAMNTNWGGAKFARELVADGQFTKHDEDERFNTNN